MKLFTIITLAILLAALISRATDALFTVYFWKLFL